MRSVMLDIETLGTTPGSAVTSIGLAAFNDNEVIATEGSVIAPKHWNGTIDPKTVAWWLGQADEARKVMCSGTDDNAVACNKIRTFLGQYGGDELWANDPSFDCVLLHGWWSRVSTSPFPSHYREERSCRTIFAEARRHNVDLESAWFNAVVHDAVSDAACQARGVILARQGLFSKRYCKHGSLVGQCMECVPTTRDLVEAGT